MRFRTKVTGALLLAGLVPLMIAGLFAAELLKQTATDAAVNGVRINGRAKADTVESYFAEQVKWMTTLAESPMTPQAIDAFSESARVLSDVKTLELDPGALREFLETRFERTEGANREDLERWNDGIDPIAQTLQQLFILNNPAPEGRKHEAISLPGGGRYTFAHRLYHPFFSDVLNRFGYYDIFLIEPTEARIVYSAMKEPDYGTSLTKGPYRTSGFGIQVAKMIENKGFDGPLLVDFEPYEPSFNGTAAFMLVPVIKDSDFKGILAFQLKPDFMDTEARKDYSHTTGQLRSYILGQDQSLRTLPDADSSYKLGDRIESDLVGSVGDEDDAIYISTNEHGAEVIASVVRINLPGTSWFMVSEVNRGKAMATADRAQEIAGYATIALAAAIAILGLVIAHILLRPIVRLGKSLKADADISSAAMKEASSIATTSVQSVAAIAEETSAQADTVRESSSLASNNVQEMSAAVEQLTTSISDVAKGATETATLMNQASVRANEAERSLADLESVADRIGGMVDLINDIANRTNLLALNAAVEAAHAGEAGRGFAVVASEIRKLAGRTGESTETIGTEVRQVLQSVQINGAAIRDISTAVAQVTTMSRRLADAAVQQETVTDDLARRMTETAKRVAEVDQNIETVRKAAVSSAEAAADLVTQLSNVDQAGSDISMAVDRMSGRILRI